MPAVLQLVSKLPNVNGLPADTSQNVINVGFAVAPDALAITSCINQLIDFWTVDTGPDMTHQIGAYISEVVNRSASACEIQAYVTLDLTGNTPFGSPVQTANFTLPAAFNALQFPEEVAVVVSYNGDLTNVPQTAPNPTPPPSEFRPRQRRRGRMFVGPLNQRAAEDGIASIIPAAIFRTDLTVAFRELCRAVSLDTAGEVSVWSKADAATYPVVGGFVDDAWDIQRRRGLPATQRTTFTV